MAQYRKLGSCNEPWFCLVCSLPRFCDSLFDDTQLKLPHPSVNSTTTTSTSPTPTPPRPRKALEFWYNNCRSVKNKLVDFRSTISALPANTVVLLTETWLDPGVHDGEVVDVSSHAIFRKDRHGRGGGVLAAIPAGIPVHRRHDLEHDDLEAIFLELHLSRGSLLIGCVYCPPKLRDHSYMLLDAALSKADTKSLTDIVLFGDFNAHIDWWQHNEPLSSDAADGSLLDIVTSANLHQICHHPSTDLEHMARLAHFAPWCLTTGSSCSENYDLWCDFVQAIQADCVPRSTSKARRRRPPWISLDIIKLTTRKRALFRQAAQLKCPITLQKAKELQRSMKATIQKAHDDYAHKIAFKAKENPKLFWSYINRLQATSHKPCFMDNAIPVTEPSSIAQLFASQFSSTYSSTTSPDPDLLAQEAEARVTAPATSITTLSFSLDDLNEAVRLIRPSRNQGPDYIAPSFFKLLYPHISHSLLFMFQSFLNNAFVPLKWKESFVTPVHKGRGKPTSAVSSYRPVSITSIVCRTFERVINRAISAFLEQNHTFAPYQHGFRPNRSCETALATVTHYVSANMDSGLSTDLIQLDLSNAFDTLDHAILVTKAAQAGLRGTLLLCKRAASPIYTLDDSVLRDVPSASILGVLFTPSLDFSLHISNTVAKARRTLGFVIRS
ncbi:hypothetical protein HPB50_016142 [Hyalomma asiaticum]|uniref:Uncharacterized protein n=1 Tax=Hyalomma asiaticum TaxID=266040 RepID=A0ACB7TKR6_HYAAI|nr:hypothetical protein HPB50_016142 [Hyalomma asiaticum]